jgi:hypothetical protein
MNFLCILQVPRIVFVLKTKFYNHFSIFYYPLDWASIFRKSRGLCLTRPKTQNTAAVDCGLIA